MDFPAIEYAIDATNRLVHFNAAWDSFALTNHAPHVISEKIYNRNLFDFISGEAPRERWLGILKEASASPSGLSLSFRCDAQHSKRFMNMRIYPDGKLLRFVSQTVAVLYCTDLEILDATLPRVNRYLRICSWCKKIHSEENLWLEPDEAVRRLGLSGLKAYPALLHDLCESCLDPGYD